MNKTRIVLIDTIDIKIFSPETFLDLVNTSCSMERSFVLKGLFRGWRDW